MKLDSKIFVAGHRGLVGSAIVRKLESLGYSNIIKADTKELDLRVQVEIDKFFNKEKPEYVFLAAAKVGGINYNKNFPADFIYDNLQIQNNVIYYSHLHETKKLLFLGSACIYPKITPQPIKEEYLLTDVLEPTNEGYALAKIAGLAMAKFYTEQYNLNTISLMPANLYGINDNFNIEQCHVIPAMINKFLTAKNNNEKVVVLFGDGTPTREFLYVDDLADACIFLMNNYNNPEHINVGSQWEYSIQELAKIIADKVGYAGEIFWDTTKPNGTPRRKLDNSKINELGWEAETDLESGLEKTIEWYLKTGGNKNV
jgi:GDP-L-fucose synthase